MASPSNSPCAACKFLRRRCTHECVFAPYFPPDQPQKFSDVHKVFGASNVAKLLNDLLPAQREDAVSSLAYEAETRIIDPVYGCVGVIAVLQNKLRRIQQELYLVNEELSAYIGPTSPIPPSQPSTSSIVFPCSVLPPVPGHPQLLMSEQQPNHMTESQQQLMMKRYEQLQQEMFGFNIGLDGSCDSGSLSLSSFEDSLQFEAEQEHQYPQYPSHQQEEQEHQYPQYPFHQQEEQEHQYPQYPSHQQEEQEQQESAASDDGRSSSSSSSSVTPSS